VHALRRRAARRSLRVADAFIAGSRAIRDDYASVVPRSTPFHVLPYGIALETERRSLSPGRPVRFGYVGSIAPHKGVHLAVKAMQGIDSSDAVLRVWGDCDAFPEYVSSMAHGSEVVFEGRFAEDEKARVFASMDVLLVPSIGLESFGLAAREAMASGVPVIASSGGALSEMFETGVCGELFPPGDAKALGAILRRIVASPEIVAEWSRRLPDVKSEAEHAAEIELVYRSVLSHGASAAENGAAAVSSTEGRRPRRPPLHARLRTIFNVVRGEGVASARRRAVERAEELARGVALRSAALITSDPRTPVLNVSAASVAPRTGGVAIQLAARLEAESVLRSVALLHPGGLELSAPRPHLRARVRDFEAAVRQAMTRTGAKAVHLEGTSEVPLEAVMRLVDADVPVIVSVHDFTLLSSPDAASASRLLASARAVVFPSEFLRDRHAGLTKANAHVIEPAIPLPEPPRLDGPRRGVAFAGAVKPHKGGAFLPDLARGLATRGLDLHLFGGGDVELLRAVRACPSAIVHGYYRAGMLPALLARHGIGLVVLPSIVPESYSLTLTEAWHARAVVAAFDLGAIAERIRRSGGGWLAPFGSGAEGLVKIVERWQAGETIEIPEVTASPAAAARAHVELYRACGLL
jgi:glycosyltransferase involved in cell wall biosynthesis